MGCMTVAPGKWRPMVVEIGPFGSLTGISKIAANVIGPLADREVSVFCLSTNQDDYVMVSWLLCALRSPGNSLVRVAKDPSVFS